MKSLFWLFHFHPLGCFRGQALNFVSFLTLISVDFQNHAREKLLYKSPSGILGWNLQSPFSESKSTNVTGLGRGFLGAPERYRR